MGEAVFFLAVVCWLAGWDVFVEGRNAQFGETSVSICRLGIARDAECGACEAWIMGASRWLAAVG